MVAAIAVVVSLVRVVGALRPAHHLLLAGFLPIAVLIICWSWRRKPPEVYLVDYDCFSGTEKCRAPSASFMEHIRTPILNKQSISFLTRLLQHSGLGEETYLPLAYKYLEPHKYCTLEASREEAELVIFSAIENVFARSSIIPQGVDILVVNCSIFSPTPSLPDIIINKYNMNSKIKSVNLSGMGCSAGMIAVDLARSLLQVAPRGGQALVVSTETITPYHYVGNERDMLLPYCLFRMGAAAVLLSTSPSSARFRLRSIVRTLTAAEESSYQCIYQKEDGKGHEGISLSMDLVQVAGHTLKANISALAPCVLPISEQLLFALSLFLEKLPGGKFKMYSPDFRTAFKHFCIHAGGRAVIDAVQRSLSLFDAHVEPSRMTLHRFGNTSSSSTWYELAYIEAKGRMCVGDRVWMIGFGSGFKCNSVVLECIAPAACNVVHGGPWANCIQRYPVNIMPRL
uniref:Uncharacterized protein n=1 Tax=Avena sativa TaxID=4498 RepID=A0ACD6APB4_AVESA